MKPLDSFSSGLKPSDIVSYIFKTPVSSFRLDPWFDVPFDRLMVLSSAEGLTIPSKFEGDACAF